MMAAVQQFISGAISKTINMPESATISEIEEAYLFAWEQGLKAVAIYRENSKRSQPLNTQKTENELVKKNKDLRATTRERTKLPQTHKSITHKFEIAGHEGYLIVGLYDEGKPGEIFITMSKQGSTIRGLMDAWATSVSLNMQYGASVNALFGKFRHQKFEPSGFVKNVAAEGELKLGKIRTASSIVDYVAQFMLNNFGEGAGKTELEINLAGESGVQTTGLVVNANENIEEQTSIEKFDSEGLVCPHCGGPAKRIGNCAIYCMSCKQTTRSGCGE
jgi:ribonucleoside-diphosphate reductase alpha chain